MSVANEASPRRYRVRVPDEIGPKLDAYVTASGQAAETVIVAALSTYLAALELGWASVAQAGGPNWPSVVGQNGPATETTTQVVAPTSVTSSTKPPRTPHRGLLPTDSDAVRALIEELNDIPDASEVPGDVALVNAAKKAALARQIGRLRGPSEP